eukprot:966290-Pleurochrysis_carterae.AAC.1
MAARRHFDCAETAEQAAQAMCNPLADPPRARIYIPKDLPSGAPDTYSRLVCVAHTRTHVNMDTNTNMNKNAHTHAHARARTST